MKFDISIGNPPYQEIKNKSMVSIYHKFMRLCENISEISSLIVPARWLSDNPNGISRLDLKKMRELSHISEIIIREDSVFEGVDISGGICYYLYNSNHIGKYKSIFINRVGEIVKYEDSLNIDGYIIRDNYARGIINKIKLLYGDNYTDNNSIKQLILGSRAFTSNDIQLNTNWNGYKLINDNINYIRYYNKKDNEAFISEEDISANNNLIHLRKIYLHLTGPVNTQVLNKPFIGDRDSVCSRSYTALVLNDDSIDKLETYIDYIKTKWFRFIVSAIKTTQHANADVYTFIPMLDTKEQSMGSRLTDSYLYKKYKLTADEIDYIERSISEID